MSLKSWLHVRTGWPDADRAAPSKGRVEPPTWRRALTFSIVLLLLLQVVTGVALMTVYSPSPSTAWASVWYMQTQVPSGWLVRGLHFFASDTLVVLLVGYLLCCIVTGAYRAPREFVWWTALLVTGVVLALAHTGYLLPWDQDGFWGTNVRMNIIARTPVVGPMIQRLLMGGATYGHGTLSRFYTLHVLILPAACVLLAWLGLKWRRRAIAAVDPEVYAKGMASVSQPVRNCLAGTAVLLVVFVLAGYTHHSLGSEWLDAPADPAGADYPARPEWYFLFLFQWLKFFSGSTSEMIGAIVVPGVVAGVLFAAPFYESLVSARRAQKFVVGYAIFLVAAGVVLTGFAFWADRKPSEESVVLAQRKLRDGAKLSGGESAVLRRHEFHEKRAATRRTAGRAIELANESGIPPGGPLVMLADDPVTAGPKLFAANCASCHRVFGHDGTGVVPHEPATSSDLGGYGTAKWVRSFLDDPMAPRFFGLMKKPDGEPAHTKMNRWLSGQREDADSASLEKLQQDFDAVAAYLEDESEHPGRLAGMSDAELDSLGDPTVVFGRRVFLETCNECHSYDGEREGTTRAPEMRGYASVAWLELMIAEPGHDTRYRTKGREPAQMPSFSDRLTPGERTLIATWLHSLRGSDDPAS